jgi:hypothetical protein
VTTGVIAAERMPETMRIHALPPERQWLFGVERFRPQHGGRLAAGAQVWLH